ncbi:MAG: serine/threonine-protein kinase [Coprococcus sp.]
MKESNIIGTRVMDDWVICELLGAGSFGRVYRIERREFGEMYEAALKVITVPSSASEYESSQTEGMSIQETQAYYYSIVEELVREIALMSRLKGTAHVVGCEDHKVIQHEDDIGWDILIRMEKLTPLTKYVAGHTMTRHEVIRLGIHLCQALELCRKKNIIHRDIKPENIFVSENGDFKLGDFGIARTVEKTTSGLSRKGTYHYMAPEVYRGESYGFDVDIYSLGIVLYKLLNLNRLPFCPLPPRPLKYSVQEEALARRIQGEKLSMPYYATEKLGQIILKAAAFSPEDRYRHPSDMRRELEALLQSEPDRLLEEKTADDADRDDGPSLDLTERWELKDDGTVIGKDSDGISELETDTEDDESFDEEPDFEDDAEDEDSTQRKWLLFLIAGVLIAVAAGGLLLKLTISGKTADSNQQYESADSDEEAETTVDSILDNEELIAACALYETGDYVEAAGAFMGIMDTSEDAAAAQKAFRMLAELYRDCAELEMTGTTGLFDKDAVLLEIELLQKGIARYQLYYDSSLYEMLGMAAYQAYEQGYADYLDVSAEAFRKVLELGVQKEYIYTNLYAIAYMRQDLLAAEEITYSMQEVFPDNYLPHAFRAIIYIKAGSDETYDAAFLKYYGLTEALAYETAYSEYREAEALVRTTDDRTYFLQLESLIQELEANGWLGSMQVKDMWRS